MAVFDLRPVLGDFILDVKDPKTPGELFCEGGRNSTRWIIEVNQRACEEHGVATFQLARNRRPADPEMFTFTLSPMSASFYRVEPWLKLEKTGHFTLSAKASAEGAFYQLQIDVMHSMHR